ncbi:unnamed protein product [Lactuca saligna]|uniref:Integrase catalytic domain-containing protein n=1 Tax=Lactuca saligna TaxID=75948 RepID=A0AA36E3J9_LACSI|nr:unnamed protein product [Lactuca saligna]
MPSSLVLTRLLTKPLSMQFMPETAPSPFMNYMKNSSTMNCHWYKHLLAPIFINQPLPLQPTNAHHPSNGTLALPIIHLDCYQRPPRTAIPPTTSLNKFPQINLPPLSRPSSNHTPQVNLMHLPTSQSSDWLFDSGASHHITNDLNALSLHSPYDGTDDLVIGDGSCLTIAHVGSLLIPISNTKFHLTNVLCVLHISRNIISISRLCLDNHILIQFYSFHFFIKNFKIQQTLLHGIASRGIYELRSNSHPFAFNSHKSAPWHHWLGHPHFHIIQLLSSYGPAISSIKDHCNSCSINKIHKLPFHTTSITSSSPLELIFSDFWSSPVESIDGFKYYIIFVDHYTKYTWLYPLKHKSDSLITVTHFQRLVETYFQTKINSFFFSDNGGEYIKLASHFAYYGITHLTFISIIFSSSFVLSLSIYSPSSPPIPFFSFSLFLSFILHFCFPTSLLLSVLENSRRWFLLCWWPRRSRRLTTFSDLPQYVDCGDCSCVYEFWGAYFCRVMFEETISGVLWSFGFERPRTKLKNKIGDLNVRQKYFIAL